MMASTIVALSGNARVSTHDKSREGLQRQYLTSRRRLVMESSVLSLLLVQDTPAASAAGQVMMEQMPALKDKNYGKTRTVYPDFTLTDSGLQYKDLVPGKQAEVATVGSKVVVDWSGVTLGYYGRIFEARNKAKGGSFTGDEKEFFRFTVGDDKVIPAFNEALQGMHVGGIRRIIVPPEIGYPETGYSGYYPEPGSFAGKRSLDFVLQNRGMMDKTLLFDIELLKIL